MLVDPQVITINAIAHSLPRIEMIGLKSIYQKSDGTVKLTVGHTNSAKRFRTLARTDWQGVVTDPLTSVNDYDTLSVYTVIERPEKGFTLPTVQQLVTGHKTWLTDAIVEALFGSQS